MRSNFLFTTIRNGYRNKQDSVLVSKKSKVCFSLLKVLKREGYIRGYAFMSASRFSGTLYVFLKYRHSNLPLINCIAVISKPSRIIFMKKKQLPKLRQSPEISLLSTIFGCGTDLDASKWGHGGNLICKLML